MGKGRGLDYNLGRGSRFIMGAYGPIGSKDRGAHADEMVARGEDPGFMDAWKGKKGRADDEARWLLEDQVAAKTARADEIQTELDAMGRPIMDAQVQTQQEVVDQARRYAQEGMPEAQRQLAQDNIASSQAAALGGASSLGAGLRALPAAQTTTAQSYRNLNAQDAMMAQANQGQYLGAVTNLGIAKGNAEQYNELLPYQEKVSEMQALRGVSEQNQWTMTQMEIDNAIYQNQQVMDWTALGLKGADTAVKAAAAGSDIRLKDNISHTGHSESGIPTYTWTYKGSDIKFKGTMAQDLLETHPHAVVVMDNGFYGVDYSQIDVKFELA
tara:strand:+ start:6750 stop:7730 length:981 start_codon:yes stop_codon:yes gene_type:complete